MILDPDEVEAELVGASRELAQELEVARFGTRLMPTSTGRP